MSSPSVVTDVCISEDEEEEEEAAASADNGEGTSADADAEVEASVKEENEDNSDDEAPVKQEDGMAAPKHKAAATRKPQSTRQPAHELKVYSPDELAKFKQPELVADVVHLDGQSFSCLEFTCFNL